MRRKSTLARRIGIFLAPVLATTTTIAIDQANASNATSTDDQNGSVDTNNDESDFQLCRPYFGVGKIGIGREYLTTFTIEGTDGQPITSSQDVTFEVVNGATVVDVTDNVDYMEDFFDSVSDTNFNSLFDIPISTFAPPLSAPGLFGLGCASYASSDSASGDYLPFPSNTTLLTKRNGVTIATADISGRNSFDEESSGLAAILEEALGQENYSDCNVNLTSLDLSIANDILPCSLFSDIYGTLVNATGRRLQPSLAYFATLFPAVISNMCFYGDCGFFNVVAASTHTNNTSSPSLTRSLLSSAMSLAPQAPLALTPTTRSEATASEEPDLLFPLCILSRFYALVPLPNFDPEKFSWDSFGSTEPLFHITSIGRGMADALSDPRVSAWPEIDVCVNEIFLAPTEEGPALDDEQIAFLVFYLPLLLYITQLLNVDIPLGLAPASLGWGEQSTAVQLKSLTRIPWEWKDNTLAAPRFGKNYSDGVSANGTPIATYSVTSGALPKGLALNATTGAITGKAKRQGTFRFTITATNSAGSMSHPFTMTIKQIRPRLSATREDLVVSFSGRVSPELRGKEVELQVFKYGAWRTVTPIEVKKNGRFTATTFTKWVQNYRVVAGNARSPVVTK
jgi:hypothetical protein